MKKFLIAFLGGILLMLSAGNSWGQIVSQYIETDSGTVPKGIEIWNNTGSVLDFSTNNLVIEKGVNGAAPSTDYTLSSGTLAVGDVIVIGSSNLQTVTEANGSVFYLKAFTFNGDDALVVKYGGTITDIIGTPGSDPGSSWAGSGVSTANQNISLISGITSGDTDGWTDPSSRFEITSATPSSAGGDVGFGVAPPSGSSIILSSDNPAAPVGDIAQGSGEWAYIFSLDGSASPGTWEQLSITSTHTNGDIASFYLYYWDPVTETATAGLGSINAVAGSGVYTFMPFSEAISGLQYFCIGVSTEADAVIGNTITISALNPSDFTIDGASVSGSGYIGGLKTIVGPTITLSETNLTGFSYVEGAGPSAEQSFTAEGTNLTNDISITPPTNYEISTGTGGSFAATNPITLTQSGGTVSTTTIYIRLKSGLSENTYNDELITASSTGATSQTLECDGIVTAVGGSGCSTDLIISEYGEGSANNKYIEIYNETGNTVDLSNYILKQSYGGAGWDADVNSCYNQPLSGSLANEDVFVIAASDANATILAAADLTISYDAASQGGKLVFFTGNDAIGLFKGAVLIDVFGDPSSSATIPVAGFSTYGGDHTIVRKETIFDGNTDWTSSSGTNTTDSEWIGYAQDTWTYIGAHEMADCGSTITISETTLTGFLYYFGNGPSASQTFTVEGSNLTNDLILTAPTNYEISDDDATFSGTLTLTPSSNTVATTTIYVRLKAGLSLGAYNLEDITASSTGATSETLSCSGDIKLAPVTNLSIGCTNNSTAEITWTAPAGTYDGVIIAFRNSTTLVPHTISDGTDPSTLTANTIFTSGTEFGSTTPYSYIIYKGSGTSVTVTGLTAGETYKVKAYTYNGTNWLENDDCPTVTVSNLGISDVSSENHSDTNLQSELAWNNPGSACFDEVLIVCTQGASVTATPSGDGSAYTANSVFGSGSEISSNEYVVYKGTGTTMIITGLTNDLTYYATIFVRVGTQWSSGVEMILYPADVTVLEYGDLAIVAVNTNGTDGDEFSFVSFKAISTGTSIDFTDNGYERLTAGKWADSEGFLRFTRQNSNLAAGTIMTFETVDNVGTPVLGTNVNVYVNGALDNANWTSTSAGSGSGFNFNDSDQIWVMQGGAWSDPSGAHNATYSGNVLYGWTAIGWFSSPGYDNTAGSTIYPGCECATTNVSGLTNKSKVKYDGSTISATRTEWIGRINDPENWDDYADNATYDAGTPLYKQDGATFSIEAGDLTAGKWAGYKNGAWCDCANWYSLKVPEATTDIEIPAHVANRYDLRLSAHIDSLAYCNDMIIYGDIYNDASAELYATGDVELSGGSFNFNVNQIDIEIGGDIIIDDISNFLTSEVDLVLNGSADQSFDAEGASLVTIVLNSFLLSSGGTKTIADNLDIETFMTVDNSIFNANALGSSLDIDGNFSLQNTASMHDNCTNNLAITVSTTTSQIFRGNGNTIKSYSFTVDKTDANFTLSNTGGSSDLFIRTLGNFNMTGTSLMTDNGSIIQTDDDLYFGGDGTANYDFTGTTRFTGDNVIGTMILADDDGTSVIAAELYNLEVQADNLEVYPTTGSQTIVVNNDFSILNTSTIDANSNDFEIGGDYFVNNETAFDASGISITLNGSTDQGIDANGSQETFGTLVINNSGGNILLSSNIDVDNLDLTSGLINTSTHRVYVKNTSISNISNHSTASYINGNLRRAVATTGSYDLPVGDATNYELANVNFNSATGITYLDTYFNSIGAGELDISGLNLYVGDTLLETVLDGGFWTISPNAGTTSVNYNVGLNLRGATNAGVDPEQHSAIKRDNSSSDWGLYGHHVNSTQSISGGTVYAYRDNITSFSDHAIAKNNNNILPVELIKFEVDCNEDLASLIWITATEKNNDYFDLEKSDDGFSWRSIAQVDGAGNSNAITSYSYDDLYANAKTYYRLKQVDYDGGFEYSYIIRSECVSLENMIVEIYPNPTFNTINLNVQNWKSDFIKIEIVDVMGKLVFVQETKDSDWNLSFRLDLSDYKSGVYNLRLSNTIEFWNYKIVKY